MEKTYQWVDSLYTDVTLELTEKQIYSGSHQGECYGDIILITNQLTNQLNKLDSSSVRAALKETGAWSDDDLTDTIENKRKLVWIACCALRDARDD